MKGAPLPPRRLWWAKFWIGVVPLLALRRAAGAGDELLPAGHAVHDVAVGRHAVRDGVRDRRAGARRRRRLPEPRRRQRRQGRRQRRRLVYMVLCMSFIGVVVDARGLAGVRASSQRASRRRRRAPPRRRSGPRSPLRSAVVAIIGRGRSMLLDSATAASGSLEAIGPWSAYGVSGARGADHLAGQRASGSGAHPQTLRARDRDERIVRVSARRGSPRLSRAGRRPAQASARQSGGRSVQLIVQRSRRC